MNILAQIVEQKQLEIRQLYAQYDLEQLRRDARPSAKSFYRALSVARSAGQPFFIAEFKRKSPSEGWINREADPVDQVSAYARAGAGAVSVLTDTAFFGGSYADLERAAGALGDDGPLLLQKDFILDPIQVYLARRSGADIILLIAAILEPDRLEVLRHTAESLGMGVLVEVHDQEELDRVGHLDFPVLGINSRDLKTFRTALNRVNVLARPAGGRFVVAESGIHTYRDFQALRRADGFLIGTSLMRHLPATGTFAEYFRAGYPGYLFKACGIRSADLLKPGTADYIGINFSPVSKRRIDPGLLKGLPIPENAVAVFYKNSEAEIRDILAEYPFRTIQVYAGDIEPEFVRSLRQKVFLACALRQMTDLEQLEQWAPDVDLFILDGAAPGSGRQIDCPLPVDFPYPFLLAGGLHIHNLDALRGFDNCIGADIASGIETEGQVDAAKIAALASALLTKDSLQIFSEKSPDSTW